MKNNITHRDQTQKVMQASYSDIQSPAHIELSSRQRESFDYIVAEVPKVEWTSHKLEMAALPAKAMCDLDKTQDALSKDGYIYTTNSGTIKEHPLSKIASSLRKDVCALRRSLAIHALTGDKRDINKRRSIAHAIECAIPDDDDGLIARPNI